MTEVNTMEQLTTLFILLLSLSYQSSTQVCNNRVPIFSTTYHANAPPFKGVVVLSRPNCSPTAGRFACPYRLILGDNEQVAAQPNLNSEDNANDIGKFLVWPRDTDSPYILFILPVEQTVTAINIEFLNYPAQNFSLPNIQLYKSGQVVDPSKPGVEPIDFTLLNNNGLSQDDHRVTNISLILSERLRRFLIYWDYTDVYNLDFFMVSEVYLCLDTQPSITNAQIGFLDPRLDNTVIIPTIKDLSTMKTLVLNCTVSVAGSFEWRWKLKRAFIQQSNPKFHIFTADGTRTSKLQITGLSIDDAGVYACEVRRQGDTSSNSYVSRTQSLSFPVTVELPVRKTGYLDEGHVVLTCEVHGFLRSTNPPTWLSKNGSQIDPSSTKYTITSSEIFPLAIHTSDGSVAPGLRSTLTIWHLCQDDEGNYTCVVDGNSSVVQLSIVAGPTMQSSTYTESSHDGTVGCTQTATVASFISSLITAVVVVGISMAVYTWIHLIKSSHSSGTSRVNEGEVYETVDGKAGTAAAISMEDNEAYVH